MAILETKDLRKIYGSGENEVHALDGVSISVEEGEFVAVIGTSGSGKSTLLNMIGGLDRPTSGSVTIRGKELLKMKDEELTIFRRRNIGFVFQNFHLLAYASALENVLLPGVYYHTPLKALQDRARFLLERVGLEDRMHHLPSQLSGGQQQRVALARALLNSPSVILADEPTGQLDSATSRSIMALFREIRAEGTTIAIVTHDPETASGADRRIVLRDGLVVDNES